MCPASKTQETDEMLKYENNQEKLITNQTKSKHYHCFALSETVRPLDLGDVGKGVPREFYINTGNGFVTLLLHLAKKGTSWSPTPANIVYLTPMPAFPESHGS